MAKWRSAGNLMAETMSIGTYGRSQENLTNSTDEIVFLISTNNKAKGKSATKKKTRSLKSNRNRKKQKMLDTAMVEHAVRRTVSLPNFLRDTELFMNQNRRRSYGHIQHMEYYSLEQFTHPPNGESLPHNVPPHRVLRPDERPLHILRNIQAKFPRIRSQFHLLLHQDESVSLQEELILTQPDYVNVTVKKQAPQLVEVNPNGTAKTAKQRVWRFNLSSLVGENGEGNRNGAPVKVGSQFNSNRFPDIRPVHCNLLPVSSNADGGSEENMGGSILVSPALDITLRPPGPTGVYLDGKKVVRPTPLRHGCILQIGRSLFLKFLGQGASLDTPKPVHVRMLKGSMPDLSYQDVYKERNRSSSISTLR
nr:Afadin [Hymenolepis microstoma]